MTQIGPKRMVGLALFAKSLPNGHPYGKIKTNIAFLSRNIQWEIRHGHHRKKETKQTENINSTADVCVFGQTHNL
jgi:hypothetical protein